MGFITFEGRRMSEQNWVLHDKWTIRDDPPIAFRAKGHFNGSAGSQKFPGRRRQVSVRNNCVGPDYNYGWYIRMLYLGVSVFAHF